MKVQEAKLPKPISFFSPRNVSVPPVVLISFGRREKKMEWGVSAGRSRFTVAFSKTSPLYFSEINIVPQSYAVRFQERQCRASEIITPSQTHIAMRCLDWNRIRGGLSENTRQGLMCSIFAPYVIERDRQEALGAKPTVGLRRLWQGP